jgi:hypothetical protein
MQAQGPPSYSRAGKGARSTDVGMTSYKLTLTLKPLTKGSCDPLPTEHRNEKTSLKLGQIGPLKNTKKGLDRPVDRSVELRLGFCFQ